MFLLCSSSEVFYGLEHPSGVLFVFPCVFYYFGYVLCYCISFLCISSKVLFRFSRILVFLLHLWHYFALPLIFLFLSYCYNFSTFNLYGSNFSSYYFCRCFWTRAYYNCPVLFYTSGLSLFPPKVFLLPYFDIRISLFHLSVGVHSMLLLFSILCTFTPNFACNSLCRLLCKRE